MLKKNVFILALVLVAGLMVSGCTLKYEKTHYSSGEWNQVFAGLNLDSGFDQVKVSTDVISIRIEPSSDEQIHIRMVSDAEEEIKKKFQFELKELNGRFEVSIKGKKNINLNILNLGKTLKAEMQIQLPVHEYKKVQISSDVGKIEYSQVDVDQLEVKNDVGAVLIKDTNTREVKISGSVGLIKLDNVTGKMDITNNAGSVQVKTVNIHDDMNIKTDVGSVVIEIKNKPDHLLLDLSTEIGSINTNLDVDYDKKSKNAVMGHKGSKSPKLKVRTNIGKIEVNQS